MKQLINKWRESAMLHKHKINRVLVCFCSLLNRDFYFFSSIFAIFVIVKVLIMRISI